MRLAHLHVVDPSTAHPVSSRMELSAVIAVLQESINVAHEGLHPGAFCLDFLERHVLPHLEEKQRLEEAMR